MLALAGSTTSDVLLALVVAMLPVVLAFLGWIAKTLVTSSTILHLMDRRVGRIERELWPEPEGRPVEYVRTVTTRSTPPAPAEAANAEPGT